MSSKSTKHFQLGQMVIDNLAASLLAAMLIGAVGLIGTGVMMWQKLGQIQQAQKQTAARVSTLEREMEERVTYRELTQSIESVKTLNKQQYSTILQRFDRIETRLDQQSE